jgi:transketolase
MPTRFERANAIRALSMDAVQKANSGHPGMPMGMSDIAEVLWHDFMHHNPNNPHWHNRDRFMLSNGHGCMLIYSLLYLTGYDLTINDIEKFRQLHSRTPGHPEYGLTPGVETTTGPLGQGLANAVGMALAERTLATQFNRPEFPIVDHYTYVFLGDGCMMEGISHEVSSLAGTLKLGKLIAFWDDNGISIDGHVITWFGEDTANRFRAYGWHVISDVNGHHSDEIENAIQAARAETERPTLICCKTVIGFGAPNLAGTEKTHGAPLGVAEVAAAREQLHWPYPPFVIPDNIKNEWDARTRGAALEAQWQSLFAAYQNAYPELAKEFMRRVNGQLPESFNQDFSEVTTQFFKQAPTLATRKSSNLCLESLTMMLPELLGGSADLSESNLTFTSHSKAITAVEHLGNYIYYGVREFGMSAIMNGIALHGGFIPYGGTFLTFSDYARNAIRLSALMRIRVIYVYTHDSIGLGEDGPTHQPIEHAAMLRLTPNVSVWRPADAVETAISWQHAITHTTGPTALLYSRQNCPALPHTAETMRHIHRGGYILQDDGTPPELILIATGSEVTLALKACEQLQAQGISTRVVSMPSTTVFDQQDADYRDSVLPMGVRARIAIEAAAADFWFKYIGLDGAVIGLNRFGESAPANDVFTYLGFTVEHVLEKAFEVLEKIKASC